MRRTPALVTQTFLHLQESSLRGHKDYPSSLGCTTRRWADARHPTHEFVRMVQGLDGEKIYGWSGQVAVSEAAVMRRFAESLE